MQKTLMTFWKNEGGQDVVEYTLLVGFIMIASADDCQRRRDSRHPVRDHEQFQCCEHDGELTWGCNWSAKIGWLLRPGRAVGASGGTPAGVVCVLGRLTDGRRYFLAGCAAAAGRGLSPAAAFSAAARSSLASAGLPIRS